MSFLQKLTGRGTTAVTDGVAVGTTPAVQDTNSPKGDEVKQTISINNHAADSENQKPVIHAVDLGEAGAQRIELMQEILGKYGKTYIFLAYGNSNREITCIPLLIDRQIGFLHDCLVRRTGKPHPWDLSANPS